MKAIYEKFTNEEFEKMSNHKRVVMRTMKLERLSWHNYILLLIKFAGVIKCKKK